MTKAGRIVAVGIVLATVISAVAFLVFPPGLRLQIGDQESFPSEAILAARARVPSFRLADKAELALVQSLKLDLPRLQEGLTGMDVLPPVGMPGQTFAPTLLTQEFFAYVASSAAITALSWTEEDVIIPIYRSALTSAIQTLNVAVPEAASVRGSVERARDILTISMDLLDGKSFTALPEQLRAYSRNVGLTNPEALFGRSGSERFRHSANLSRYQASVIWTNHATNFERSRDIPCLAVLGFAMADDMSTWSRLSSFYRGLIGLDSVDSVRLSSVVVSVFGHTLTEEKLTDTSLLGKLSSMIGNEPWGFPFQISLFGDHVDLVTLTEDLPHATTLLSRVSQLRASLPALTGEQGSRPEGLTGIWLDQLLNTRWRASDDRTTKAIAGSYALLLASYPSGMNLDLTSGVAIPAEVNQDLCSRLDSFLVGMYDYVTSTVGVSNRVNALLLATHDLLASVGRAAGSSGGTTFVEGDWAQRLSLILRVSGLSTFATLSVPSGETLHRFTVRLVASGTDDRIGALYATDEAVEEG